jgi:hypothetical protein
VLDPDALRRVFLADQAEGAVEEARRMLEESASVFGLPVVYRQPSPWALRLLKDARRVQCPHRPREGSQLVLVPAHVRQWMCRPCGARAVSSMAGRPDEVRCDVCREVGELTAFVLHRGTLVITGRHCGGCRATVHGRQS